MAILEGSVYSRAFRGGIEFTPPLNLSMLGMMITNEDISIIHSSSINHFPSQSVFTLGGKGVATPD